MVSKRSKSFKSSEALAKENTWKSVPNSILWLLPLFNPVTIWIPNAIFITVNKSNSEPFHSLIPGHVQRSQHAINKSISGLTKFAQVVTVERTILSPFSALRQKLLTNFPVCRSIFTFSTVLVREIIDWWGEREKCAAGNVAAWPKCET